VRSTGGAVVVDTAVVVVVGVVVVDEVVVAVEWVQPATVSTRASTQRVRRCMGR
jgi:hypothetical protein